MRDHAHAHLMQLQELELRNFRNFGDLKIHFDPKVNVLVGANGQGKTNLIESIFWLLQGKTFRAILPGSCLAQGRDRPSASQATIRGRLQKGELSFDVKMELGLKSKVWTSQGKRLTSTKAREFPIVLFSPESLSVIKDGPDARRNFVDDLLSSHLQREDQITQFRNLLRTRNRILRDFALGHHSPREAQLLLESINDRYLHAAASLTHGRLHTLRMLQPEANLAMAEICGTSLSHSSSDVVTVEYLISGQQASDWEFAQILEILRARSMQLRQQEYAAGCSLVGPHKHDIKILFHGQDSRFYCSQGQQRALILAFKMARIVYHNRVHNFYPILLLDDVLSELDIEKRGNLVAFLDRIRAQIFITTTDLSLPSHLGLGGCRVLSLFQGQIRDTSDSSHQSASFHV